MAPFLPHLSFVSSSISMAFVESTLGSIHSKQERFSEVCSQGTTPSGLIDRVRRSGLPIHQP